MAVFNWKMGLKEIVEYKKEIQKQVDETGENIPDEVLDLSHVASQLLAGKIDAAARFKESLESHLAVCKEQQAYLQKMIETTEMFMKEAISVSGGNRLDGNSYSIRIQNNSRATTVIEDQDQLPKKFLKVSLSQSFKYDEEKIMYWSRAILKRMIQLKPDVLEGVHIFYRFDITPEERDLLLDAFRFEPIKTDLESALKKERVSGARLERGSHLRVEAGKAKSKAITEK
jgi:hypothetical protein